MSEQRRRTVLQTAATGLASALLAGCTTSDTGRSGTDRTDESETDSTTTTSSKTTSTDTTSAATTSTQSESPDYGPWDIIVSNDLEEESTVTVRVLAPDGDLHDETEVTLADDEGTEALTVSESGSYTLKASTDFDSATAEFNACKLNAEAIVELYTDDGERRLRIDQLHMESGAGTTIDDPFTCE
ncbi:hypothetical protein [Halorussus amylolyticus]|uniref:hypothetical protein n=1 Tax=Halorussus amylolyticus TaxID=1126242 RepID=UPI001051EAAA|nr:hypothetical protein [Halorussus amylolyticus]